MKACPRAPEQIDENKGDRQIAQRFDDVVRPLQPLIFRQFGKAAEWCPDVRDD